mmetsp:Transcript_106863/g.195891  ORF Transcript_106863/g.195891 Transcript_106863/m.195891 type:complete len:407 (-) Transcript_106863:107-1327(-)
MTGSLATDLAEAEEELNEVTVKLDQLEELKAMEAMLRTQFSRLTGRVTQLRKEIEDEAAAQAFYQNTEEEKAEEDKAEEQKDEENHATSDAQESDSREEGIQQEQVSCAHQEAPAHQQEQRPADHQEQIKEKKSEEQERKSRIRALNKKLQQIEKLKAKGGALDPEAAAKVASEPELRRQVDCLERGEDPMAALEKLEEEKAALEKEKAEETKEEEAKEEEPKEEPKEEEPKVEEKPLPEDPTDRQKRLRTLRKKLQDIERLKGREGALDVEALAKVESEQLYLQEVAALEAGSMVFVFDEDAAHAAKKDEAEKKLKKLNKRLEQIQELKNKGTELDSEALAKVESEQALKKEIHQLQAQIGSINKQERERVARRLGWEQDWADQKAEEKTSKKARSKARSVGAGA